MIAVHLKGHAAPTRHALAYWRDQAKAGAAVAASVIHTTRSPALSAISARQTMHRPSSVWSDCRVSWLSRAQIWRPLQRGFAIGPYPDRDQPQAAAAGRFRCVRSRQCVASGGVAGKADCPATNQVFQAYGDRVEIIGPSRIAVDVRCGSGTWSVSALDRALRDRLPSPAKLSDFVEGLGI